MSEKLPNETRAELLRNIAGGACMVDTARELEAIAAYLDNEARSYRESQELQDIGKSCAESLAEMVAALECDYERLAELRESKANDNDADGERTISDEELAELAELESAAGDCESREDAEQRIQEYPLSIELSGTWVAGGTPEADKAFILLGTGGPATRIVCELNEHMEPYHAWIEAQDWFLPWTEYTGDAISNDDLLMYCRCFYFGEG